MKITIKLSSYIGCAWYIISIQWTSAIIITVEACSPHKEAQNQAMLQTYFKEKDRYNMQRQSIDKVHEHETIQHFLKAIDHRTWGSNTKCPITQGFPTAATKSWQYQSLATHNINQSLSSITKSLFPFRQKDSVTCNRLETLEESFL